MMSQDKRKYFGSRISSIFSSNDTHHHSKSDERKHPRTAPLDSLSVGVRSNQTLQKPFTQQQTHVSVSPINQMHSRVPGTSHDTIYKGNNDEAHKQDSFPHTNLQHNQIFTSHNSDRGGPSKSEVAESPIPRAKPTRKPPPSDSQYQMSLIQPNTELKLPSAHQLDDVLGSIEKELIRMRVESEDLPARSTSSNGSSVSNEHFQEHIPPLQVAQNRYPQENSMLLTSQEPIGINSKYPYSDKNILMSFEHASTGLHGQSELDQYRSQIPNQQTPSMNESRQLSCKNEASLRHETLQNPITVENLSPSIKKLKDIHMEEFNRQDRYHSNSSQTPLSSESPYSSARDLIHNDIFPEMSISHHPENIRGNKETSHRNINSDHFDKNISSSIESFGATEHSTAIFALDSTNTRSNTNSMYPSPSRLANAPTAVKLPYPSGDFVVPIDHQASSDMDSSNYSRLDIASDWEENTKRSEDGFFETLSDTMRPQRTLNLILYSKSESFPGDMSPLVLHAQQKRTHTRMLSVNSVNSAGFNRHVSLATLKMTFSLRPGEGEKSNYIDAIRKSAGTSFNEAGPGKWKLPTGIMPVDKRELLLQNNKKFTKGSNQSGYKSKKSSGVELKHGHLQPRLLAAEVDEGDSTNKFGSLGRSSTLQNKVLSPVSSKSSIQPVGLNGISRANSLERANTFASASTAGDLQSSLSKVSSSRPGSTVSLVESIGSIPNDQNVDIYYQHQSFKMENDEESLDHEDFSLRGEDHTTRNFYNSDDEKPQLFLANPDSD